MLQEIERPLVALEQRRSALLESFAALPAEALGYHPPDGGWSLLEVAEHLLIAEVTATMAMAKRPRGKRARRTLAQSLRKAIVDAVLRLGLKVKAPSSSLEPRGEWDLEEITARWRRTGREMREALAEVREDELGNVAFRHPVSGPLDFPQGLAFLNRHFDHHLLQIRRLRAAPGFPSREAVA